MSDPAVAAQRQQQRQQGLIAGLVTLPFRFFGVLCGALLLCILIECVGMHFFWPDQGWRHAQGMLHYELDQLSTHFTRSALVQEPGRTAHRLVEQGYDWLFVKSGLLDWIRDASTQASAGSHRPTKDFRYYIGLVYVNVESYLIAAAYTTLVFLVRLLVLCLTLPLFLMAAFVGLVDGLVHDDRFMLCADFEAYWQAQLEVEERWRDPARWWRSSVLNTARTGWFSSDRTIREYAREIWKVM